MRVRRNGKERFNEWGACRDQCQTEEEGSGELVGVTVLNDVSSKDCAEGTKEEQMCSRVCIQKK